MGAFSPAAFGGRFSAHECRDLVESGTAAFEKADAITRHCEAAAFLKNDRQTGISKLAVSSCHLRDAA